MDLFFKAVQVKSDKILSDNFLLQITPSNFEIFRQNFFGTLHFLQ